MRTAPRPFPTVLLVLALIGCAHHGHGEHALRAQLPAAPEPASAALARLDFLAGRWVSDFGGGFIEEAWGPAVGDGLVGTFRWLSDGRATLHEVMTITDEGDDVVFRLRHFDPGLAPWAAEADGPLTLRLASVAPGEAVFTRGGDEFPTRLVYRREGEALTASLSGGEQELEIPFQLAEHVHARRHGDVATR